MKSLMTAILGSLLVGMTASAGEVCFSTKPTATKEDGRVKIAFAVSAPIDVEVAVLDTDGKVVRHLAAGVLGAKNPPPEPLKAGLAQTLEWDMKDDFKKPAAGGPFKVRVRAGLGVKFGRFIGGDPYTFGGLTSIASDEEGRLYITACPGILNQDNECLRVFTADGEYLRSLVPFPADLKPERVSSVANWNEALKRYLPKNSYPILPVFYPWGSRARLASVSTKNGLVLVGGASIFRMDADGGNVRGPYPMWSEKAQLKNARWNVPQIAASPDGKYLYYSNVAGTQYEPKHFKETDPKWPQGRVYRQDITRPGSDPEKFYDLELPDWEAKKYWLPNAWNARTAAYSIATDPKGHVFIGDLVNQEIVEVDPAGKKVSATKVAWPERVLVDGKSGAFFVLSRQTPLPNEASALTLVKIEGRGPAARKVAELPLNISVARDGVGAALAQAGGAPVVWIAGLKGLLCVKDSGARLEAVGSKFKPRAGAQQSWNRIAMDYEREEIYASDGANTIYRYDGKSGEGGPLMIPGVDVAVGYDGLLYYRSGASFSGPLERYDRDLKPVPFPSGSHVLSSIIYSRYGLGNCEKGLGVGPKGECYINFMYGWNKYFVAGFGADGKAIKGKYLQNKVGNQAAENKDKKGYPPELDSAVIGPVTASCGGIRVDLQGNIYVGLRLRSKGHTPPPGLEKDPAYDTFTGSIVKFPPSGGTVLNAVKGDNQPVEGTPMDVVAPKDTGTGVQIAGALAIYDGIGPFSGDGWGGWGSGCVCRVPRFDIDRFGRLAFPNPMTDNVTVMDNAGNKILEFGRYGNFDSQYVNPNTEKGKAGKPTVETPDVPLGWATGAGFSKNYIFANDYYNRRVVRVDKTYAAEAVADVK